MRRLFIIAYSVFSVVVIGMLGVVGYAQRTLPNTVTVTAGETVRMGEWITASADLSADGADNTASGQAQAGKYVTDVRLFGLFPVKSVTVSVVDAPVVTVCGTPFGIKLYTDGVLIVGMSDVHTAAGDVNPAAAAGIVIGDTILSIDGVAVSTNEDVAACINACDGRAVTLRIRRDGVEFDASFVPARPTDGEGFRAGLWVRDSTAGVGILTFYCDDTRAFAGLGHPVCDADTGETLSLSGGEIVPARIFGIEKSIKGTPSELCGAFENGTLGRLEKNVADGLFGTLTSLPAGVRMPLAMKQEVEVGAAQLFTTVDGTAPAQYDIEILQVRRSAANDTRSMIIRVTDERLLSLTGGIVQGMSGSPILQGGKIVGAVTHVLVNDPTRGYGIFIEDMIKP